MAEPNRIVIVSEHVDLSSPSIDAMFAKQTVAVRSHAEELDRFRKSVQRSMLASRKDTKESLGGIADSLKSHQTHTKKTVEETKRFRIVTAGLRREIGALRNQFLLFFFVYRPLKSFLIEITKAAGEQEDAIKRLGNALENQGTYSEHTTAKLVKLSESLQKMTRYADEEVLGVMEALVSTGNVLPSQLERVTKITLDFATKKGNLAQAINVVSKVMAGYTGQLSKLGIAVDESIPKTQRATAALALLEEKFKGAAQKDIDSYRGKVAQLTNAWNDFYEALGKGITESKNTSRFLNFIKERVVSATNYLNSSRLDRDLARAKEKIDKWQEQLESKGNRGLFDLFTGGSVNKEQYENAIKKFNELTLLKRKEIKDIEEKNKIEEIAAKEKENAFKRQKELQGRLDQTTAAMEKAHAEHAQAIMQTWEDVFFDGMTNRFKKLSDIVVDFGNTALRILIRLGIQKAIISAGMGAWFGLPGTAITAVAEPTANQHSGGYIRYGQRSSSGPAPRKYHSGGEVPAMLLPGEGVLNRSAMNNLGVNNLNRLNNGGGVSGGQTINNYYIQTIDERSFRERLQQNGDVYTNASISDYQRNGDLRKSTQRFV